MPPDHGTLGDTLASRGAHVVFAKYLEKGRSRDARRLGERQVAEGRRRQHEMDRAAPEGREIRAQEAVDEIHPGDRLWSRETRPDAPTIGQPAEVAIEDQEQQEAEDEHRRRKLRREAPRWTNRSAPLLLVGSRR